MDSQQIRIDVPEAGQPERTTPIDDAELDRIVSGLEIPSQGTAKALARLVKQNRANSGTGL